MKKIVAAGGLVLNEQNELLMMFRRGHWDLPKGKLDDGETILECAVREVKEETGLQNIVPGKKIGTTVHEYFDIHVLNFVQKETHWFEMNAKNDQALIPQTDEDIVELKWVQKKDIEKYLKQSYKNIIDIIKKAGLV
jgi:8-oxo-dGTP pyrophosphatase MutT (NUDIX family)